MNKYSLDELLPILKELTEKYTSKESTSIPYEKANQLMNAINYCISEFVQNEANINRLVTTKRIEAYQAYQNGYELVKQKVIRLRNQYNNVSGYFNSYGNRNYEDTFIHGIPQFFLRYDPLFDPDNHIITMDYPIIGKQPYELFSGVDAMDMYIHAIELEQKFLRKLPSNFISYLLNNLPIDYKYYYFNICSIVLRNILITFIMKEKYPNREKEYCLILKNMCLKYSKKELEDFLKEQFVFFIKMNYDNDSNLREYLELDLSEFTFELQNAANSNCLENIILL